MRLALTGGGTGGHVYPALEVGRLAIEAGDEVHYFGSLRGIEGNACKSLGVPFFGVPANPIPKLASLEGLRSVVQLLRSTGQVRTEMSNWRPSAILATGGYSSAPALRAARQLGVPIVLHEQNTVPGRSIASMGSSAAKICTVFKKTCEYFPRHKVVETGMPIRRELVKASTRRLQNDDFTTLVVGGSQGARALNAAVVEMAAGIGEGSWLHVSGKSLYDETKSSLKSMPAAYKLEPFLDADAMATALATATIAIARAGSGTIAELALFGLPAIFVPLPTSFANHQLHNAREIEAMGAATVIEQGDLSRLEPAWRSWRNDEARREVAAETLREWARPDAADRVLQVVKEVAR